MLLILVLALAEWVEMMQRALSRWYKVARLAGRSRIYDAGKSFKALLMPFLSIISIYLLLTLGELCVNVDQYKIASS